MKEFVVVCTLVVALAGNGMASSLSRNVLPVGMSIKFNVGLDPGRSFFFLIPLSSAQALKEGWYVKNDKPPGQSIYDELLMLCYEKCNVCVLYERHCDFVAGLQIGINKRNFTGQIYDMNVNGWTNWTTVIDGRLEHLYVITQYYLSEGVTKFLDSVTALKARDKSYANRLASCNRSVILQEGYVYAIGTHGNIIKNSANGTQIREEKLYTQQACIYWMGTHYYHKMSETTKCTAEDISPWFLLVHGDNGEKQDTIGCCMMTFGKMTQPANERDWFERPNKIAVQTIVPRGPKCLYDLTEGGVLTMHVFFTSKPDWIFC